MIHTVQNAYLTVSADEQGAQLMSILGSDGTEYLWQGDESYWSKRSPVIFPFVARLTGGKYLMDGKEYQLPIHGLAPYARFQLEEKTDTRLVFVLHSSEETKKAYPRDFVFRVSYALHGSTLEVVYQVENRDSRTMHFALGGHPGFNVPLVKGLEFTDYRLRFSELSQPYRVRFNDSCFVTGQQERYSLEGHSSIPLRHDLFDRDAIVLVDMPRQVTLESDRDSHKVTVSYPRMGYVGFWHMPKTDAPYVCIEPWSSLPARAGMITEFESKDDLLRLEPGLTYTNGWHITVE